MRKFFFGFLLLLVTTIGVITGCSSQPQQVNQSPAEQKREELIIAGSGSNIAVTRKLLTAFNEEKRINIILPDSIGSGGGISGVANGSIDLGITSRSLTEAEKASGLKEIPYAHSGLIVAVGSDVPDDNVSYEDLVMIYQGNKNTWSNGAPIIVFVMYEKDSTNEVLIREVPAFKEVLFDSLRNNRWKVFYNQQAQEQALARRQHSIGFINMPAAMEGIKVLNVNGIKPSRENILNGSYKLYKTLNYVYREPIDPNMRAFIDFTFSQRGREILLDYECIPLSK
jgi:phosphate transport system substrate-binding protein